MVVFIGGRILGYCVTLLYIWAWKHIVVLRIISMRHQIVGFRFVDLYGGTIYHTRMGDMTY